MSHSLADNIPEQVAVVDRLAEDTSSLAIRPPSIMDLDPTHPAIVISSPDVAMLTPTSITSLDQSMISSESLLEPANVDLGSPKFAPHSMTDDPRMDADEPAAYFREPYIEADEPAAYFRPPYIEPQDEDAAMEYFDPDDDELDEYFRPPHLEEASSRPASPEIPTAKMLHSVENWLDGLHSPTTPRHFPVTPPWRKSAIVEAELRPISLLNEPFYPKGEGKTKGEIKTKGEVRREICPLGDLLGLIAADGWCLGCGVKHESLGGEGVVFGFAPRVEVGVFNPFNVI